MFRKHDLSMLLRLMNMSGAMKKFILVSVSLSLYLFLSVVSVTANERPSNGGANYATLSCRETRSRTCWGNGHGVNCGPIPAANYAGESVDPNGYLAGAYGSITSDALPGGCPHVAEGAKFTVFASRSYDNWHTQQNIKLYVEVVNTNGWLTLNTKLDKGGGCNLPVTHNVGDDHYGTLEWEAKGNYEHHCW